MRDFDPGSLSKHLRKIAITARRMQTTNLATDVRFHLADGWTLKVEGTSFAVLTKGSETLTLEK